MGRVNITEIIFRGRGSTLQTDFGEPLLVGDNQIAEIGLKSFAFYNSIPNVTKNVNNCIRLAVPGSGWETVSLETGSYELSSIAQELSSWIQLKYPHLKDVDENFKLRGNDATSKAEFTFKQDYGFNFDTPYTIAPLMGFNRTRQERGVGRWTGDRIVNITNVTNLVFNTNISEPNFINNIRTPFLFNCTIDVPSGYRLSRELSNIQYKRLNTNQLTSVKVWITDQFGSLVDLRNELVIITLSLRVTSE